MRHCNIPVNFVFYESGEGFNGVDHLCVLPLPSVTQKWQLPALLNLQLKLHIQPVTFGYTNEMQTSPISHGGFLWHRSWFGIFAQLFDLVDYNAKEHIQPGPSPTFYLLIQPYNPTLRSNDSGVIKQMIASI